MNENNKISGRVKRYAKVGVKVGSFAARKATSRYLGINWDRGDQAEALSTILGSLKGPLMKVAQILSTVPDILGEEFVRQYFPEMRE